MSNQTDTITVCIPLTVQPYATRVPFPRHVCDWTFDRRIQLWDGAVQKYFCRRLCGAIRYEPLP